MDLPCHGIPRGNRGDRGGRSGDRRDDVLDVPYGKANANAIATASRHGDVRVYDGEAEVVIQHVDWEAVESQNP